MSETYEIIVLDLDGTLTNSKKVITPKTKDALMRIQKEGKKVVLASGRPTGGIVKLADELDLKSYGGFALAFNGGKIINYETGEIVYNKTIPVELVPVVYEQACRLGVGVLTYKGNTIIHGNGVNEYSRNEGKINGMPIKEVDNFAEYVDYPVNKFLMTGEPEKIAKAQDVMRQTFGEQLNIFRSEPFFLEIVPPSIDKAYSLGKLLEYLGEKKEPSSLWRTSFLFRFGEHRDNSRNSLSVFPVVTRVEGKENHMEQTNDRTFLETEPVGKLLLKLALPTVAAQLINMMYNIVDRMYIGHIPGDGAMALTGVGVCMPLIMVVSAFAALISNGGAPRATIFMGKGEKDKAEKTLGNCFCTQIIVSLILTAFLLAGNRGFLLAFGASENTISFAADYMNIYAIGTIFVQLTLGMNAFITAQGFARTSMLSVLIGAVINIVLDPVFIFGFGMGVKGAALATVLSQACSCIWVLAFLCGKKTHLRLKGKNMVLQASIIWPSIALGTAMFIMQASESVISVCFNSSLLRYGGDMAVGAMTILTSVMQFALLPLQGLGQGAQPIISYNYGAKRADRVKEAYFLLLKIDVGFSFVLWALVMAFPRAFAAMFTSDAALIAYTGNALRIYLMAIMIFGIQMACQMAFTSLGKAVSSIIVAVMRKFVLLLPLIYIMPHIFTGNQAMAVYMAEPVADVLAVSFTSVLFYFQFRKVLRQIEE